MPQWIRYLNISISQSSGAKLCWPDARTNRRRRRDDGFKCQHQSHHHLWEWQLLLRGRHLRWYLLYAKTRVFYGQRINHPTDLISESFYSVHIDIHHFSHCFHLHDHHRRSHRIFFNISFRNSFDHSNGQQGSPCNQNDSGRSSRRFRRRCPATFGHLDLETSQFSAKSSKRNAARGRYLKSWLAAWVSTWSERTKYSRTLRWLRNPGNRRGWLDIGARSVEDMAWDALETSGFRYPSSKVYRVLRKRRLIRTELRTDRALVFRSYFHYPFWCCEVYRSVNIIGHNWCFQQCIIMHSTKKNSNVPTLIFKRR